jgi:hypothetical protein
VKGSGACKAVPLRFVLNNEADRPGQRARGEWGGVGRKVGGEVGRRRGKAGAVADDCADEACWRICRGRAEEGSGERSSCDRRMEEA